MKMVIKISLFGFIIVFLAIAGIAVALWYVWSSNLPYIGSLKDYHPPIITEILDDKGQVITQYSEERRILVPLEQVSYHTVKAFIAAEDDRFFEHKGIDFVSIARAFFKNIMAGKIEQGGSTITQQVTKSLLLKNPARTYKRKVREALLSLQIEREFSKEEILYLYLNQIYLGHGQYGVEAASRTYFGKTASELSIAESAILAGLAQAPSKDSPTKHFDRAKIRQKYVLERMREEGFISDQEHEEALAAPLYIRPEKDEVLEKAAHFIEHIRRIVERKYGRHLLYKGGLKIYTTVNLEMQAAGKDAVRRGIEEFDKREGFRGPIGKIAPGDETEFIQLTVELLEDKQLEVGATT